MTIGVNADTTGTGEAAVELHRRHRDVELARDIDEARGIEACRGRILAVGHAGAGQCFFAGAERR